MKINKKIFAGMAALALLFGLVLTGCLTLGLGTPSNHVDTVISQEIYETAVGFLDEVRNGPRGGDRTIATVEELMSELANQYPGLTLSSTSGTGISFEYQGNSYFMRVDYTSMARVNVLKVHSVKQVVEE